MPWCPKCENEYVEGMDVCPDCGMDLVDELSERRGTPVIFGEEEQMERLKDFLFFNKIESAEVIYDENENVYELYVNDTDRKQAVLAVSIFMKEEAQKEEKLSDDGDLLPKDERGIPGYPMPDSKARGLYQNSEKQAEENRSSGYMLLIIGGAGLVAIILLFMGIIPINMAAMNKYMVCGVMGGLFVLFIVMGLVSMKSSLVLAKKAETENNLKGEITRWCEENLTAEIVDEGLFQSEQPEEEKYFKRVEKMKQYISHQFMNLDEGFLDSFTDEYYQNVFE